MQTLNLFNCESICISWAASYQTQHQPKKKLEVIVTKEICFEIHKVNTKKYTKSKEQTTAKSMTCLPELLFILLCMYVQKYVITFESA